MDNSLKKEEDELKNPKQMKANGLKSTSRYIWKGHP